MNISKNNITDKLGRPLQDLRISVTDKCNFRCRYCMPEELFGQNYRFLEEKKLLTFEEIQRITQVFVSLGIKKLRITGGEPLLRKDLPMLIRMIKGLDGVQDIALTTNGSLLPQYAKELKDAGLHRVTVSLDSLDDKRFGKMNGRGYPVKSVLEGIDSADSAGLSVKVNMVVQKGWNEQDILPMARFFREKGHILRFIEFMDVGNSNGWELGEVVSSERIVEIINTEMPLEPIDHNFGEVAYRYRYKGSQEEIGIIASVTRAFCSSCTRARISADGQLYLCLFSSKGFDLRTPLREGASDQELAELITNIWLNREERYSEERLLHTNGQNRGKVEMFHIGG